jgi:acyl-CoA synthetase (AMP-forming)/AMP-acid ligase II/acyl carrier protein
MRCQFDANTMMDLLVAQAAEHPDQTAYVFLDDRDGKTEWTFADLERRARAIASRLQLELQPGDRAILVYPPGLDFIAAFFGCMYAGVVAVPATYPKPRRPMPRLSRIAIDCDAHVALSTAATLTTLDPELLSKDAATSQWIATDELPDALATEWQPPQVDANDLAFLQYTSGSTSDPKGVMVSHANLLNNLDCIRRAFGIGEADNDVETSTGVFWLPAYHDMGLIGGVLTPLYMGGRSVLMSPTAFLQRPIRWLQTIHQYHATISGAPNFAYDLCARRTKPEEREGLDLSRWRLAFCGAEPIRPDTLKLFADTFAASGFRSKAFYPCYGLAETTLLAAGPNYSHEPVVLAVNRQALAEHRVAPACGEPDEMTQRLVGCGQELPDHQLVIVRPESSVPCEPDEVGEILISGPSVCQGYWNRAEECASMFGAHVDRYEGRFVRTGDLGFLRDGELFVTGRLKDVVIIRGRNHYPQDIEQTAEEAHPAVLMGAAFALENEGAERLVVVHQIDRQYRDADFDEVVRAVRRAIVEQHDLDPYAVVLIRQTSLPITSSGKVQRSLCREQYLADELKVVHAWTNPATTSADAARPAPQINVNLSGEGVAWSRRETAPAADAGHAATSTNGNGSAKPKRRQLSPRAAIVELDRAAEGIEAWMLQWLVAKLALKSDEVQRDRPFAEYGVDSLTAVELSHELEEQFKVPLPPIVAWNYPTPATLARYIAQETTGIKDPSSAPHTESAAANGDTVRVDDDELAKLLAEVENLSDDEAARQLADERRRG